MITFDAIRSVGKVCGKSGRELKPGDRIVSVLMDTGGRWERVDYAKDSWSGPPSDAIAWWNGRIPPSSKVKTPTFRDEVLFECLDRLADHPSRGLYRYVVAILLMRRKKLLYEGTRNVPGQADVLILRDTRTGNLMEIVDPQMNEERIGIVQEEVIATLAE